MAGSAEKQYPLKSRPTQEIARASVAPDPENKFPLKSRPAPAEQPAREKAPKLEIVPAQTTEGAPENLPVAEVSREQPFKVEDTPDRLAANGNYIKWRIDHVGLDGNLYMSVPRTVEQINKGDVGRKAIVSPEALRAELKMGEKVREIFGENATKYDAMLNILSELEIIPDKKGNAYTAETKPENVALRDYLRANKGQIMEYIVFSMEHKQMTQDQAAAQAINKAKLAAEAEYEHFFEVDYSLAAESLNKVAAEFEARRLEANELLGEKVRLANIFTITHGRPGLSDIKTQMSADVTAYDRVKELERIRREEIIALELIAEPTMAKVWLGDVDPAQYPESTIAEREEQLKIDLEEALNCLKTADEKAWPVDRIRELEQRLLEDYNELRVAKAEQAITDWQDLPGDWIDFLRAVKQAKLERGVAEKYVIPEPKKQEQKKTVAKIKKSEAKRVIVNEVPESNERLMEEPAEESVSMVNAIPEDDEEEGVAPAAPKALESINRPEVDTEEKTELFAGGDKPTIQPVPEVAAQNVQEATLSPADMLRAEHPALSPEDIEKILETQRRTKESKLIAQDDAKMLAAERAALPKVSKQEMADMKKRNVGGVWLSENREPTTPVPAPEAISPRSTEQKEEKVKQEAQEIRREAKEKPKKAAKPEQPPVVAINDDEEISVRGGISAAAKSRADAQPVRPSLVKRAWSTVTSLFGGAQKAVGETEEKLGLS